MLAVSDANSHCMICIQLLIDPKNCEAFRTYLIRDCCANIDYCAVIVYMSFNYSLLNFRVPVLINIAGERVFSIITYALLYCLHRAIK